MSRIWFVAIVAVVFAAGSVQQTYAAPITWIGGNANWDLSNANWNPADEPDSNDEAIFNTPNTVNLTNVSESIQALTLSGGIDLNLNGNTLIVDGLAQLVDASTTLFVGGSGALLSPDSVTINSGATVRLTGGTVSMVEETGFGSFIVNSGGTLSGNGLITLGDGGVPVGTSLLTLSGGTLSAASTVPGDIFGGAAATLTITVTDADGRIDLDNNGTAVINVDVNDTLQINGASHGASDPFSGTINLRESSTISMSVPWQTDSGTINANTGSFIPGVPGGAATIAGSAFTFAGGTIALDAIDSLRISAPFTATSGTISNAGLIIFNTNSTIGTNVDFQMVSTNASITVNSNVTVNIDDADFNTDGSGTSNNLITIHSGGVLDLDLGTGADESLTGVLNLNGGELDVTTGDSTWLINGPVNVGANTGTSQINGEEVTFTSTTITVGTNSILDINAPSVWAAAGNLVTSVGATTRIDGTSTFNSAGTFTGAGSLLIGGAATFATATTINMPSGTVDLDGADGIGNTITFNANLTINAGTMSNFGNNNFIGVNTLSFGPFDSLTVNLTDPNAEWTFNTNAVMNINAVGGGLGGGGIQGSDFNMNGTANISGNSIWNARTDISGTVNVAAAGSFSLRGGTLTDFNRLIGGTITGAGVIRALTDEGLAGFGTIDTGIEFANNTELRADDGILNVTGPITDVGVIGTADSDGILNVTTAWNTSVANEVELNGGEIRGALITNGGAGGINGDGLLSARVINTTFIEAMNNGTLLIQTAANNNDWDGALGTGLLNARGGNLELRDDTSFLFTGTVSVNSGRQAFANGFELEFEPTSTLSLTAGTYRSTTSTDFGGTMTVGVTGQSFLQIGGTATFENGSASTLNNNLRLNNSLTVISVGADFTGSGALINPATRTLRLLDGVVSSDFNALVQNEGVLQLGVFGTDAQAQAKDFQQSATGALQIDIGGTALNAFDRLNLSGAASLSGGLNLALIGGFVPAAGQTFNILTAGSGISGTFTSVTQPPTMPAGLAFSVSYSAFIVQLLVTTPYEAWINSFPSLTDPAQKLKTADPDGDKLNNLVEFALDGNPTNATPTGKVVVKIALVGGVNALTLTLPVRTGSTLDPVDPAGGPLGLKQTGDGLTYSIQASDELVSWTLDVTEVLGVDATAIQAGLPSLNAGWVYRTFRSPGPVTDDPIEFMRIVIGE